MDHIPLPRAPNSGHVEVPFLQYDYYPYVYSGPWNTYPERQGYEYSEFYGIDAETYPKSLKNSLAAFVQSWLFFGVLEEFLGIPCFVGDWTTKNYKGDQILSTARLYNKLENWRLQISSCDETQKIEACDRLDHLLDRMYYFHGMLSLSLTDYTMYSDLLPQTLNLSLDILHATLTIARNVVFTSNILPFPNYRHSVLVKDQVLRDRWCLSDIYRVYQDSSVLGQYYVSRLGPLSVSSIHSQCTEDHCKAWQVDHLTYQTKHRFSHCQCSMICVSTEAVADILRAGYIPSVCFDAEAKTITVSPTNSHSSLTFTAISHVWGDGLGNPQTNGLPLCQLLEIQRQVTSLHHENRAPSSSSTENRYFWMDTPCVPVGAGFEAERNLAISRMVNVYQQAENVLILSRELGEIDIRRDPWELSARINRTAWFRRLWTLHEGVLSKRSIFQLHDGVVELSSLAAKVADFDSGTSTIQSHLLRTIFQETCMPFTKIETFKSKPLLDRVRDIWTAVQWRSTSYEVDETICLANMLGLDLSPILTISRFDPEACENRMKAFILLQRHFPTESIFESSHRLDVKTRSNMIAEGFRWAPKSFVFHTSRPEQLVRSSPLAHADTAGIHLSLPGLDPMVSWTEFMQHVQNSIDQGVHEESHVVCMLSLDWDYYYTVSWIPENVELEVDGNLQQKTCPVIAMQEDIFSVTKEAQDHTRKHSAPRMFDLDLMREGVTNAYDLRSFEWPHSEALLLAISREQDKPNGHWKQDASERRSTIVARVTVTKRMFSTFRKPAAEQVKRSSLDPNTDTLIPTFAVLPVETRWCVG